MMESVIRDAQTGDVQAILNIYAHYVLNTPATFEEKVPSLSEFENRIASIQSAYPYLVCEANGEIIGYAYASRHRERTAYRYDADVSIYLRDGMHGKGAGTALYTRLFDELGALDVYNAYAAITIPNDASVALHRKFGFTDIGVHHKTGYKFGKWHDVLWLERALKDHSALT